ncbi:BadF/BadG/BcrA/BcrD ATPase family protein [Mesobacterium pallidum]|uniref:BadF/BadG/BcrA/BcrD ATPase family protein n=1 Tax=Mesobacterium pallidum TaxID=2872037 RepID=UPI001EE23897|nr:BadF/BadG/BcrA/BcrD ATPase family protein [Mesobacterium pallidum]
MTNAPIPDHAAVDGGGTGCRVALVIAGHRYEATGGPANVSADLPGALANIRAAIREAAAQAGVSGAALGALPWHFALAGVLSDAHMAQVRDGFPGWRMGVSDDRLSTVIGALGAGDGAVISTGTGSFLAAQQGGAVRYIGGWGVVLGDEASGAWLGRAALAASLRAVDGLEPEGALYRAVMARCGDANAVVALAMSARSSELAQHAGLVFETAEDPTARAILDQGADYLRRGLGALGWVPGHRLCWLGGLATSWQAQMPELTVSPPGGGPLDGALSLARRA